ncbi:squalene synthase HpnC [Gandjariella thermophila]|uniref:squalene synthase HpnC n=1 Tax=Gandjariella thermophila TaxID=1931992 RepID=UPI001CEFA622|nr:squalene synthase HpnC [Gandjariella thermophila]
MVDTPARPSRASSPARSFLSSFTPSRLGPPPTAEPDTAALHRRARGENFTVASYLLPSRIRRRLMSIYAFARLVDDIGDEVPGNRMVLFDKISRDLDRLYAGFPPPYQLYRDLAATINECRIPRDPFDRLVAANRQDQVVRRYDTFDDLLGYCTLAANPIGHLVLYVFDVMSERRKVLSDKVCSALQVLEHCQDVPEDYGRGRIYLPTEDLKRFGVAESDLAAPRASREVRALLAFETQRALRLLDEGSPVVETLTGAARLAVAGYVAGGRATAAALAEARFDVLTGTPRPRRSRTVAEWVRLLAVGGAR